MYAGLYGNIQKQRIKSLYDNKSKTQSNVFNSLMSNWDTYKKMMSEFDQGMQFGSANKEMENQLTSIEGRLNSLKVNNNASYVQKCAQDTNLIAGNS